MVLTVSRDRGWRLFKRSPEGGFSTLAGEDRAHARMVLDCAWAGKGAFVTASRDKTLKVWRASTTEGDAEGEAENRGQWVCVATHKLAEAATAVAVTSSSDGHLVAVGTEGGAIDILTLTLAEATEVKPLTAVSNAEGHAGAITRLAFCPAVKEGSLQLASAGEDRAVRVYVLS